MSHNAVIDEGVLRKALEETLQVLGRSLTEAVISDLNSCANDDPTCGDKHLDLGMISDSLGRFFDEDATDLLMQRMILRIDELASISGTV